MNDIFINDSSEFLMHSDNSQDIDEPIDELVEEEEVRAILIEDLDPTSSTYGAMSLGSLGFQIASSRTEDDNDWNWTTFGNAQGFNADLITAGTLNAININGSTINGGSISGASISGNTISGGHINGSTINGGSISGVTINNGNGTFLVDENGGLTANNATIKGEITSGSTISGSTITGSSINNGNGTFQVDAAGNLTANNATLKGTLETTSTSGTTTSTTIMANGRLDFHSENAGQASVDVGVGAAGLQITNRSLNPMIDVQVVNGIRISEGGTTPQDVTTSLTSGSLSLGNKNNSNKIMMNFDASGNPKIYVIKNGQITYLYQ